MERLGILKSARESLAESIERQRVALEMLDREIAELGRVPDELPDLRVDAKELAGMLRVSLRTLYSKIDRGEIPRPLTKSGKRFWSKRQIESLM